MINTEDVSVRVIGYPPETYESSIQPTKYAVIGPSAHDYCLVGRDGVGRWRLRWFKDGWQTSISNTVYGSLEQALLEARSHA